MTKVDLNNKLKVLLTASKIVSPHGEIELDLDLQFALFNALKPVVTRHYKQLVKARMLSMLPAEKQVDLVDVIDEVSGIAAEGLVKSELVPGERDVGNKLQPPFVPGKDFSGKPRRFKNGLSE